MAGVAKSLVLKLDPRTDLFLLVLANIIAFTQRSLALEISWVVLLLALSVACGCRKNAALLAAAFAVLLFLQYVVFPNGLKILAVTFSTLVSYARKIFPCLIVGTILVQKNSVRELMQALRCFHLPQGLIIPLTVTLRYFPALREEVGYIRDAMKLRDIQGLQRLECLLVPIMIKATATAEELSAAAVTRGIENPKPKTSLVTLRLGWADAVCVSVGIIFMAAALMIE